MSNVTNYKIQRIDHLGIVTALSREIRLVETLHPQVGKSGRKGSYGESTLTMIQNALGFSSQALYLMPNYPKNKPLDLRMRPGQEAEDFNDDRLGRCLGSLYEARVTEGFVRVASKALRVYGIEPQLVHLDSTLFHLHGEYHGESPGEEMVSITYGYSRDHRADLKQVVAQPITSHKSNLPVWLEVLCGNSRDKERFAESVTAYCKPLDDQKQPYFVMDGAAYSEKSLKAIQEIRWLMRVPQTLAEAKRLVKETEPEQMVGLSSGSFGNALKVEYAGIAQRREQEAAEKQWRKVCQTLFNCQEDAQAACKQFNQRWKYHRATQPVTPITQYAHSGRPQVVGYCLTGVVEPYAAGVEDANRSLGKFILVPNELDAQNLSAAAMLENYTAQGVSVVRGFRFLKAPLFFANSLFLKNPARIMAFIMIMGLALLIFALAERKLRQALKENHETIPAQKGKPTQTSTLRWVFQVFEGLDVLSVRVGERLITRKLLNLRPVHQQVIRLLGPQGQKCYLFDP
jgi:transposase